MIDGKHILDVTCGPRGIWFNKHHPAAIFCDRRKCEYTETWRSGSGRPSTRHCIVDPDVIADFTSLPFATDTFDLVVFDPPHLRHAGNGWISKVYTALGDDWERQLRAGFGECMRVLRPWGTLILKWAETQISTRDLIDALGAEPLFGHHSGKRAGTHWLCFTKEVAK